MKKSLIALAVAGAMTAPIMQASAGRFKTCRVVDYHCARPGCNKPRGDRDYCSAKCKREHKEQQRTAP